MRPQERDLAVREPWLSPSNAFCQEPAWSRGGGAGGRGGNNERMTEKRRHSCVIQGPGPGPALTPLAILPTTYHVVWSVAFTGSHHASSEPKVLILSWLWEVGMGLE